MTISHKYSKTNSLVNTKEEGEEVIADHLRNLPDREIEIAVMKKKINITITIDEESTISTIGAIGKITIIEDAIDRDRHLVTEITNTRKNTGITEMTGTAGTIITAKKVTVIDFTSN